MSSPTLSISKVASCGSVVAGTEVCFTVTIVNTGVPLSNAILTDLIPPFLNLVSFIQQSGPRFSVSGASCECFRNHKRKKHKSNCGLTGSITANVTNLGSTPAVFVLKAIVDPAAQVSTITNTVQITGTTGVAGSSPVTASASSTIGIKKVSKLLVNKCGPKKIPANSPLKYTISITNCGPSDAVDVILEDVVPIGTSFLYSTYVSGPVFSQTQASATSPTIVFTFCTIPVGSTAVFEVIFAVASIGIQKVKNIVRVSSICPNSTFNTFIPPVITLSSASNLEITTKIIPTAAPNTSLVTDSNKATKESVSKP